MYIVSLDCIECWKQRPFFFSPKEMKCVVKFSCSLVGGTSSFQLLFLLVLLLFVSHLLEAIPVASILSLSIAYIAASNVHQESLSSLLH